MKVSEKSLELNIGAEMLGLMRNHLGMAKAYLRGLTQSEERNEGVDFFVQLDPSTRIFAFQFKAPRGQWDNAPYLYTIKGEQHAELFRLAQAKVNSIFYVFPFYVTPAKLQQHVPNLLQDTWLLDVNPMPTDQVFNGKKSTTVYCEEGWARINPEYKLRRLNEFKRLEGIPAQEFAEWYSRFRELERESKTRRDPWLARGLRIAIVKP